MATDTTTRLHLRPGVQILRAGPRSFLVVNSHTGAQLSCGAEERYLLHLLEHCDSLDAVREAFGKRFGPGLAERPLREFVEQLRQLGVLANGADTAEDPPAPEPAPALPAPAPLSAADPHAGLNRFFDHLVLLFGWLLQPVCLVPVFVLTFLAVNALVRHADRVLPSMESPTQWLPPALLMVLLPAQTLLVLGLPYNLFLGMVCRRHGGRLRGFGLNLYERFVPNVYCDFGDSYLHMSDRGMWTLMLARIWCILAVGSVCILCWAMSRPGSVAQAFWIWMLPPCLGGLFFQLVPFFEGAVYYMICKYFEEPGLRDRACAETRAWLTFRRSPEALTADERYWLRVYGLGFYLFRLVFDTVVVVTLAWYITARFAGLGALLFCGIILYWYRVALRSFLMSSWSWLVRGGGPWWLRWPLRLALVAGVVALGFIPYSHEIVGECRLIPQMQYGVRAQLTDEITAIHVSEGDEVAPGSVIATLSGRSVRESYLAAKAELEKAQAQLDLLRAGFRAEDIKIAEQRLQLIQIIARYNEEQMKREERLLSTSAVSREQYDRYKREHDAAQERLLTARESLAKLQSGYREEEIRAAESAVRVQEARVKHYEEQLTLTQVTTPFGGRVVTPYMEQKRGQQAKAGELLAVLQDTAQLRVEIAADDSAAAEVEPGQPVHVRLYALGGRLLTGRVERVAHTAEQDRTIGVTPVRTDHEAYQEQIVNARAKSGTSYHVRVYVELDETTPDLKPEMTGYARIVVREEDVLWRALVRPVARFLRTEVWSWLP